MREPTRRRWIAGLLIIVLLAACTAWWWRAKHLAHAGKAADERLSCDLPAVPAGAPHPGMVWVPSGTFQLGDTEYPEEQPIRQATVAGLWMDRTEVSNDDFAAFVKATGYVTVAERPVDQLRHPGLTEDMKKPGAVVFLAPEKIDSQTDLRQWWRYVPGANWRHPGGPATDIVGRGSFPVVTVTYEDAQAYAKWKGRRLPTEAEWEWAARAGQTTAGMDHDQPSAANTWQGAFPIVNSGEDGFVGLAPSGCYPPNALGLYDMIGNVWEITTDIWNPSHQMLPTAAPDQMPADMRMGAATDGAGSRVIKGGSFLCAPNYCARYRSGSRQPQEEDLAASHLGFRTVLLAPPP